MPDLKIERLALKLFGLDPRAGERLANAVAAGFERMPLASDLPQRAELVHLEVRIAPGASSEMIVTQMMAALAREIAKGG
jgi:hypothetical protein